VKPDDWRLQGQEKYLSGREWSWKAYRRSRDGWEHDHCALCSAKLAEPRTPDSLHEAYATQDSYYWVCEPCFEDFREQFSWTVATP
jgi:hypothetical protein